MFPGEIPERIAKALEIGHDLSGAVDYLLGDNDSKCCFYIVLYGMLQFPLKKFM